LIGEWKGTTWVWECGGTRDVREDRSSVPFLLHFSKGTFAVNRFAPLQATSLLLLLALTACGGENGPDPREGEFQALTEAYADAWIDFYPSSAVRMGLDQHLASAEDRTTQSIQAWIRFNRETLTRILEAPASLSLDLRIDLRLVGNRARQELSTWEEDQPHLRSPAMYAQTLGGLLRIPEAPERMAEAELEAAILTRINAISPLAQAMQEQLESGTPGERDGALRALRGLQRSLETQSHQLAGAEAPAEAANQSLQAAIRFLENDLLVEEASGDFRLGRDEFARELNLYYGTDLTPEELAERALAEIHTVREIIAQVSAEYWEEAHSGEAAPADPMEMVRRVSADMEENRPSSEAEALEAFTRFAQEAEAFVRDAGIATLPSTRTLEIVLTPESAGPSQRIGFVASAPPFDPTPMTTLSLPTIPDTFPEQEKEDFYRSFNNHFNKAIIIHELFPGHYMQLKLASENPRRVRTFFPYSPYVEGWATVTEILALEAGWDDFNKLTYLAHLRKRLENANRAYNSVQVHCFGWTEEQVSRFSEEEALLAPQFAKSLWGRLERGPMQMTSYFVGKDMFAEILEAERERLGDDFQVKAFTDPILRAGAIPMDMIPELLASQ
jgi:uncharacterized protein (DUF885 family)